MEALRKFEFMSELLQSVLQAHGGIDRWNKFTTVSATFVTGGGLMPMKGVELPTTPLVGIASIHEQKTVIKPFGQPDRRMVFRAYFNGYARWTYLTTPFFMAMPGFQITEIQPWQEGNERWRGLRVRFPETIASHSKEQDFYFGDDFLLRRHDYNLEIAGGAPVAQYVSDIVEAEGFRFPSKRRAYVRGPGLKPVHDLLLISLDIKDFALSV